jgi:hypothetical protein
MLISSQWTCSPFFFFFLLTVNLKIIMFLDIDLYDFPFLSFDSSSLILPSLEDIKGDFMSLFTALTADEHDSVRLLAIEASIPLAKKLSKEDYGLIVIPALNQAVKVGAHPS